MPLFPDITKAKSNYHKMDGYFLLTVAIGIAIAIAGIVIIFVFLWQFYKLFYGKFLCVNNKVSIQIMY